MNVIDMGCEMDKYKKSDIVTGMKTSQWWSSWIVFEGKESMSISRNGCVAECDRGITVRINAI